MAPHRTPEGGPSSRSNAVISDTMLGPTVQASTVVGGIHLHQPWSFRPPVPRQLPACTASFAGRQRDLAMLDRMWTGARRTSGPTVMIVTGLAGVGKTTLALAWLKQREHEFRDGQLYADLRGYGSDSPAEAAEILSSFVRALGIPPKAVPTDDAELANLYRSLTAGRTMAVLLDNVSSADQVKPLLDLSAGLVMVTGRRHFPSLIAHGAHLLRLEPMEQDDALELLRAVAGPARIDQDRAAASRLARVCGRLPIALTAVATQLVTRPSWSVVSLEHRLKGQRGGVGSLSTTGETSVQAAFDMSYRQLSAPAAMLYRILGSHPGLLPSRDVAVAAADEPAAKVERYLAELLDANLLQEIRQDRYRQHDLVRLHARQLWASGDDERTRAVVTRRILDWYLATATRADRLLEPHRRRLSREVVHPPAEPVPFQSDAEALSWLADERLNLMAALRSAQSAGLATYVWQLADSLWGLFHHLNYVEEWVTTRQLGVTAARESGDRLAERRLLHELGMGLLQEGQLETALTCLWDDLRLADEHDPRSRPGVLASIGRVLGRLGRDEEAIECLAEALAGHEAAGDRRGEALVLIELGRVVARTDRLDDGLALIARGRELFGMLGDRFNEARALVRLAEAAGEAGRTAVARGWMSDAAALFDDVGVAWRAEQLRERLRALPAE